MMVALGTDNYRRRPTLKSVQLESVQQNRLQVECFGGAIAESGRLGDGSTSSET